MTVIAVSAPQSAIPFGKYLLLKRLAVGGMAELFLAEDTERSERVVLKRVLPHLVKEPDFLRMFLDEARIAAQLHHPHIVRTHELGKLEEQIFLAMEFVEGVDLRKVLQEEQKRGGALPARLAAAVVARVAAALGYAHAALGVDGKPLQVIHRDVSPQNVMVGYDGTVKLVDFGIAKATTVMALSKPGVIKGKFLYLSPEQLSVERLDARSDLFALGSVLYELSTGKSPFWRPSTEAIIYAIRMEEPPPPESLVPDYPPALSRVVMRCLAKQRERRYQRAEDIQADLEAWLAHEEPVSQREVASYVEQLFGDGEERTSLYVPPAPVSRVTPVPRATASSRTPVPVPASLRAESPPLPPAPVADEEEDESTVMARPQDLLRPRTATNIPLPRAATPAPLPRHPTGGERPASRSGTPARGLPPVMGVPPGLQRRESLSASHASAAPPPPAVARAVLPPPPEEEEPDEATVAMPVLDREDATVALRPLQGVAPEEEPLPPPEADAEAEGESTASMRAPAALDEATGPLAPLPAAAESAPLPRFETPPAQGRARPRRAQAVQEEATGPIAAAPLDALEEGRHLAERRQLRPAPALHDDEDDLATAVAPPEDAPARRWGLGRVLLAVTAVLLVAVGGLLAWGVTFQGMVQVAHVPLPLPSLPPEQVAAMPAAAGQVEPTRGRAPQVPTGPAEAAPPAPPSPAAEELEEGPGAEEAENAGAAEDTQPVAPQRGPAAAAVAEAREAASVKVRLRAPRGTRVRTAAGKVLPVDKVLRLAPGPLEVRLRCRNGRSYRQTVEVEAERAGVQTLRLECRNKPLK